MKPAPFDYHAPASVEEALDLLRRYGSGAKLLAGGQSLVPLMNFRLAQPEVLIDLNRIQELSYAREEEGWIALGAMLRQRIAETSPFVRRRCPILAEALGHIGHRAIRNRGTLGGTLAHADPASEVPTVFRALDGEVRVIGPAGERRLGPAELLLGPYTTGLAEDDLIVEARFPVLPAGAAWGFAEISRRHGDFALVCVAAVLELGKDGRCRAARIALGGVAPTPVRATEAEARLVGARPDAAALAEAAELAAGGVECESDYHASAEYRAQLARVLVRRALTQALEREGIAA